jgi:hypothetical protein
MYCTVSYIAPPYSRYTSRHDNQSRTPIPGTKVTSTPHLQPPPSLGKQPPSSRTIIRSFVHSLLPSVFRLTVQRTNHHYSSVPNERVTVLPPQREWRKKRIRHPLSLIFIKSQYPKNAQPLSLILSLLVDFPQPI